MYIFEKWLRVGSAFRFGLFKLKGAVSKVISQPYE
jgi:hypothetical protein